MYHYDWKCSVTEWEARKELFWKDNMSLLFWCLSGAYSISSSVKGGGMRAQQPVEPADSLRDGRSSWPPFRNLLSNRPFIGAYAILRQQRGACSLCDALCHADGA